mgnify:FL=1
MTVHAINRPAALVMLFGLLAGLAGIMLGGFSLAQRLQEHVAADTAHLAVLRPQIKRLSTVPLQPEATQAHDDVGRFLLPASAPGTASARLQSRLITL